MVPKVASILIPILEGCGWEGQDDGTAIAFQKLSQEVQYTS